MKKIVSIVLSLILLVNFVAGMLLVVSAVEEETPPCAAQTIPETQETTEPEPDVQPQAEYPDPPDDTF